VPVNLGYIRDYRRGLVLVSSAGIVANMIFAFLAVLLLKWLAPAPQGSVGIFLTYLAQINIILAAFNLIPIPPLDGSKILMGFLPDRWHDALARLEPYGFFIIIGLLFVGALNPLIRFFRWLIRESVDNTAFSGKAGERLFCNEIMSKMAYAAVDFSTIHFWFMAGRKYLCQPCLFRFVYDTDGKFHKGVYGVYPLGKTRIECQGCESEKEW